jgi:hypothetical protein
MKKIWVNNIASVAKIHVIFNPLMHNGCYSDRTAWHCILNIYSTNIRTEYFKHAA